MNETVSFFRKNRACRLLSVHEGRQVEKYHHFRALLQHNHDALKALAELQQLSHLGPPPTRRALRETYEALLESVYGLVLELNALADGAYADLETALAAIDDRISATLKFSAESLPACLQKRSPFLSRQAVHRRYIAAQSHLFRKRAVRVMPARSRELPENALIRF